MTFTFSFTESCLYTPADWENDTNKLGGFSLGILPRRKEVVDNKLPYGYHTEWVPAHQFDSVRLVWRPQYMRVTLTANGESNSEEGPSGRIELYLYLYEQGVRRLELLGTYDINTTYKVGVIVNTANVVVILPTETKSFKHNFKNPKAWGYTLNPYIGGTAPAVQNIELGLATD